MQLHAVGDEPAGRAPASATGSTATLRDAGNGFFFVDVDGRRIFNNQETYGFPDHEQIFARLDALREQPVRRRRWLTVPPPSAGA